MLNLYVLFPLLAIIIRFGTEHARPSTQLHYTFRNATVSYCHTALDLPFFKGNFLVLQNTLEHDIESRKCLTRAPSVNLCARKGIWACTHVCVWWCVCLCVCVSAWSLQQNTAKVGLIVSSNNDFWGWQNCTRLGLRPALVLANAPSPKQP